MILKLDNPVGNALAEVHSKFCLDYNNYKFYKPENCVFGSGSGFLPELKEYDNSFFIVGDKPVLSEYFQENGVVACDQMVMDSLSELEFTEEIVPLGNNHKEELFALVDLVQPGYFKKDTADLGDYFGIFKDGKLAAVTGERMKMDGFTEISAVVAHPQHHRKGYAKQLVVYTAQKIINENKIPFLHVAEGNLNAIALYERLGFKFRRKMNFWKMSKR